MEQISDKELAKRWGQSLQKIKDMCNPVKNKHYCPTMIHPQDYFKLGKDFIILYNLSLEPSEIRPRVLQRPSKVKAGNPNFKKKKPQDVIPGLEEENQAWTMQSEAA
jgi:hypothetical protein